MILNLKKFKEFEISKENQKLINGSTSGYSMTMTINNNPCTCGQDNPNNWEYGQTSAAAHFTPCNGSGSAISFTIIN